MTATPTEAFNARELAPRVESSLRVADRVCGRHNCPHLCILEPPAQLGFHAVSNYSLIHAKDIPGIPITAPLTGPSTERPAYSRQPIAELPALDIMKADIHVLEADAGGLQESRPAELTVEAAP